LADTGIEWIGKDRRVIRRKKRMEGLFILILFLMIGQKNPKRSGGPSDILKKYKRSPNRGQG
jgi:hypothetical protein